MHAARLDRSDRLQRVAALLRDGREYSTRDIIRQTGMCAINSIICELRENRLDIQCRRQGDIYFYRLVTRRRARTGSHAKRPEGRQ